MSTYRYFGRLSDGNSVEGIATAIDSSDLELRLMNRGITLEKSSLSFSRWQQFTLQTFKRAEITRITRQLSLLLKSQISVLESLQLAREQLTSKDLQVVFDSIITQVESGKSVAQSLAEYPFLFDRLYVSMVEAGEMSGKLDFALDTVASYREKYEQVTRKIKSALAYPALVVAVAVLVVFALVLYVVPVFSSMYENFGAELPSLTKKVVDVSAFLRQTLAYWLIGLILAVIVAAVAGTTQSVRRGLHKWLLRLPIIKILLIKLITVRFCRTMGSLLTSGVDILSALQIASRTTGNLHADSVLEPVGMAVAQGRSFTDSLEACRLFPRAVLRLSASGEKTGRLGEMLTRAADYYESQTDTEITTITTLIEPIVIIVLGAFIAFILVAMYLPLFELVGAM